MGAGAPLGSVAGVAALGECMIEVAVEASGAPGAARLGFGGDTLNTAVYLARSLGAAGGSPPPVRYVTALGDDPMSERLVAAWAAEGIGTDLVYRLPGRLPGLYLIATDGHGERSFYYWRDQSAARSLLDGGRERELARRLAGTALLYLSGITLAILSPRARRDLLALVARLAQAGTAPAEIVTAGTPAFRHALQYGPFRSAGFVHRVSPGTVVFHDARTEIENPGIGLVPAALVLTRVVSHPAADIATCDAGSKSVAAESGDPCAYVLGDSTLEALKPSEEHLPLRVRGDRPARGTTLLLVPQHVCPTVNLAEQAVLVEAGTAPRIVPVAARAHELG